MKSIVFFNNKGGVGKTTLSCNIASYLATKHNKRVLVIDGDPQCNATQSILPEDTCAEIYLNNTSKIQTIYDVVQPIEIGESEINKDITPILSSANTYQVDLLPGHPRMSIIEDKLSASWNEMLGGKVGGARVSNWNLQLLSAVKNKYDIVIFDVGPSLGALNRTFLLASDFIASPLGCDIFSLLGIKNIAEWIKSWSDLYHRSLQTCEHQSPGQISKFPIVSDLSNHMKLAGYSVQQYVTRSFKEGKRPVKAYDEIMKEIPDTIQNSMSSYFPEGKTISDLSLGHIPYLYSLIPLSQTSKTPIHLLTRDDGLVGSQYQQKESFENLLGEITKQLLKNIG